MSIFTIIAGLSLLSVGVFAQSYSDTPSYQSNQQNNSSSYQYYPQSNPLYQYYPQSNPSYQYPQNNSSSVSNQMTNDSNQQLSGLPQYNSFYNESTQSNPLFQYNNTNQFNSSQYNTLSNTTYGSSIGSNSSQYVPGYSSPTPTITLNQAQITFKENMRKLWEDHITWTRIYIISAVAGLGDTDQAKARLLENQDEIGNAVKPYYGDTAGSKLTDLLKTHITLAGDLLAAAKSNNSSEMTSAETQWYSNADDIAVFLATANPNWSESDLKNMLDEHLSLTKQEAVSRLSSNWDADIAAYDQIHNQALTMADTLSDGIMAQFPEKFTENAAPVYSINGTMSSNSGIYSNNTTGSYSNSTTESYSSNPTGTNSTTTGSIYSNSTTGSYSNSPTGSYSNSTTESYSSLTGSNSTTTGSIYSNNASTSYSNNPTGSIYSNSTTGANQSSTNKQVAITETGLPLSPGFCWPFWSCMVPVWQVNVNNQTYGASVSTMVFTLPSGTYSYQVMPPQGYSVTSSANQIQVNDNVNLQATFTKNQ